MTQINVNVTVADDYLDSFETVLSVLRENGLEIEHVAESVGVVGGSISPDRLPSLRSLPYVASVSEVQVFQLPPPDEEIQ